MVCPLLDSFHVSLEAEKLTFSDSSRFIKKTTSQRLPSKHSFGIGKTDGVFYSDDFWMGYLACFSTSVDVESRFELQARESAEWKFFLADYSVERNRV